MYPVTDPKKVCDCCYKQARWVEPRFGYSVCDEHKDVRPVDVAGLVDKKRSEREIGDRE